MSGRSSHAVAHGALGVAALLLAGCAPLGSLLSPYSETFSCKNDDHGQCIHPDQAYADAVAGIASKSDRAVTRAAGRRAHPTNGAFSGTTHPRAGAYDAYRESVYRELKGLIDAPVTPMLRPARAVRTLILPYADRQRPDRLYMPRYIYSIVDRPEWVVGAALAAPAKDAFAAPILSQQQGAPRAPNVAGAIGEAVPRP